MANEFSSYLVGSINQLMELKSEREHKNFTMYQLAKAINMPHSMLIKLLHADPNKRVLNPRVETLAKIVRFFQEDGFNITIDDVLSGNILSKNTIEVADQVCDGDAKKKSITLYDMSGDLNKTLGLITLPVSSNSEDLIAFISSENIEPMFKKGSVFIVDKNLKPTNNTLVAAVNNTNNRILIRKYYVANNIKTLKSYDNEIKDIDLSLNKETQILGVIIQVDAKT